MVQCSRVGSKIGCTVVQVYTRMCTLTEIMIQGINYMVLNVIVNNFVTIEKSFFNNFIHNSEQGQVLLSEPIVLNPQLVQGLK